MRISDWSSDVCSSDLDTGSLTVDRNIDRRRAIRAKAVGRFRKRAQIDVIFLEKASIAEYDCLVVDDADDAFAHGLVDPRWLYEREPAILSRQIGRAHVCTPVTNAHLVCRLLLEKKK